MATVIVVVTVVGKNTGLHPRQVAMMKWSINWVLEITVLYEYSTERVYGTKQGPDFFDYFYCTKYSSTYTEKTYCNGNSV